MKQFLLTLSENRNADKMIDAFLKDNSLFKLRSTFRGTMGMPRMRSTDARRLSSDTRRRSVTGRLSLGDIS